MIRMTMQQAAPYRSNEGFLQWAAVNVKEWREGFKYLHSTIQTRFFSNNTEEML